MPQQREPRSDCCRSCLRGSLRGLNYLLAIIGVLMTAYALFMWVQWHEATPEPSPSPPTTMLSELNPLSRLPHRAFGMGSPGGSLTVDVADSGVEDSLLHEQPDKDTAGAEQPSSGGSNYPWFIYLFGGAGIFVFITASVGILSADCAGCGVTCFLGLYHALMVLMLLLQFAVVCFYFFDKSWEKDLPTDSTGEYAKLRDIIMHNIRACKIAGLATLGLQLLALMVSCSLYYAEGRPRLEPRLLQQHPHPQDYETASHSSLPYMPLPSSSRRMPAGRSDAHMRATAKYGTPHTSPPHGHSPRNPPPSAPPPPAAHPEEPAVARGYDAEAGRAAGAADDDMASPPARSSNCVVM